MDTVTNLIEAQARRRPDAPAILYEGRTIRFAELAATGRRAARGLADLGLGAGDRVALWLPNTPAYLALWLGCARIGAVAVAVNTRFRSTEVGDILARSGARLLVLWPGFRGIDFPAILDQVDPAELRALEAIVVYDEAGGEAVEARAFEGRRRIGYAELIAAAGETPDRASPEAGLNIFATSGTTKAPKFVLHGQGGITRHARIVAEAFGYQASDGAILEALPLCGVFGFCQATASLAAGRPMVLTSSFGAERAVDLIERHNVQHLNATDDMIQGMLEASPAEIALPSVRYIGYAGFNASLEDLPERAERRGLTLVGLYGMSEVQALFARQPPTTPLAERRLGGGRLVTPEAEVRVRDPDSGRLLAEGESGELELKGPSQMLGYDRNPEATAETITEDGFIRTGDLGYRTGNDGFVYLSRMGDVLRLGGFLVSPAEIEAHIQRHPSVAGCQVVGVETENGTRPVAFVTLAPGGSFDATVITEHCLGGLAKFKAPARIVPLDAFPTTPSANGFKIQRVKLREMAATVLGSPKAPAAR